MMPKHLYIGVEYKKLLSEQYSVSFFLQVSIHLQHEDNSDGKSQLTDYCLKVIGLETKSCRILPLTYTTKYDTT